MAIVAKFGGTCVSCGGRFSAGTPIEWKKGEGARHETCPKAAAVPTSKQSASSRKPPSRREPRADERLISRRSAGRGDRFDVGLVVTVRGEDGWWTVASAWLEPPCEDNGQYDWRCVALVRPATEIEALEASCARAKRQRQEALAAVPGWLAVRTRRDGDCSTERVPAGAWGYSVHATTAGSETLYVSEDALWLTTSNYDDGPRVWRLPITAEDVALLAAAIAMVGGAS